MKVFATRSWIGEVIRGDLITSWHQNSYMASVIAVSYELTNSFLLISCFYPFLAFFLFTRKKETIFGSNTVHDQPCLYLYKRLHQVRITTPKNLNNFLIFLFFYFILL